MLLGGSSCDFSGVRQKKGELPVLYSGVGKGTGYVAVLRQQVQPLTWLSEGGLRDASVLGLSVKDKHGKLIHKQGQPHCPPAARENPPQT